MTTPPSPPGAPSPGDSDSARIRQRMLRPLAVAMLPIGGQLALAHDGFEVVGDVVGMTVRWVGWAGGIACRGSSASRSGAVRKFVPTNAYSGRVAALYSGRDIAVSRMVEQAKALAADGVVDVSLTEERVTESDTYEYVATGVAVRARSAVHLQTPFTAHLTATEVSSLLRQGFVPTGVCYGICCMSRHDDRSTRGLTRPNAWQNGEVGSYSELVAAARHGARQSFAARARKQGGNTAVVSAMTLACHHNTAAGHLHHVAEAMVTGTALAFWRKPWDHAKATPLSVLSLKEHHDRAR